VTSKEDEYRELLESVLAQYGDHFWCSTINRVCAALGHPLRTELVYAYDSDTNVLRDLHMCHCHYRKAKEGEV
jgi:hypothetical protein